MAFKQAQALMAAESTAEEQQLQRDRQKFMKAQAKAQAKAEKKAQGKSLWSSVGGTLGGIALPALASLLTGGIASPMLLAAISGAAATGGSFLGSKAGETGFTAQGEEGDPRFSGDIKIADMPMTAGKFHTGKRGALQSQMEQERQALKEYQAQANRLLDEQQITGALTSGVTAGTGAYAKGLKALEGAEEAAKAADALSNLESFGSVAGQGVGTGFGTTAYDPYSLNPFQQNPL